MMPRLRRSGRGRGFSFTGVVGWVGRCRSMNRTQIESGMLRNRGMKARTAVATTLLLFLVAVPVRAHHSGAMFDMAHLVTMSGVVTKVEWTNPHTFMYVNVKSEKGVVEEWAIEINSPNFLRHNGWTSTTVSPGDTITCTGAPAKSGSKFMHGMTIQLANGVQLRS